MIGVSDLQRNPWGLARARQIAQTIAASPIAIRSLVTTLFANDPERRKRAADVARRITEIDSTPLAPYADQLAGLLTQLPREESRTRWHLALVVPRIAHTRPQRLRAANLMLLLAEDPSNVVRCSAVEGLGTLALVEPSLRADCEQLIQKFLINGSLAMRSRSRHIAKLLARRYEEK